MRVIPQGKTSRYVAEIWVGDAPLRELWMGDKKLWPDASERAQKLVMEGMQHDAWDIHALRHGSLTVRLDSGGKEYSVSRIARETDVCTSLNDGMSLYFADGDGPLLSDVLRASKVYVKAESDEYMGENYANYREHTSRSVTIDLPHLPGTWLYTTIGKGKKRVNGNFSCSILSLWSETEICNVSRQYRGHWRGNGYSNYELTHDVVPGDEQCQMTYWTGSSSAAVRFQLLYPAFSIERELRLVGWVPEQKEK